MMLKINQQSLDHQRPENHLRPQKNEEEIGAEEEEEDFYIVDVEEEHDCKVPPMFL
jgi:hypothetical protein